MEKENYSSPVIEVLEASMSQIICQSGSLEDYNVQDFNF